MGPKIFCTTDVGPGIKKVGKHWYRMYWSPAFRLPQITESLNGGVNRFKSLKRFLHFNNNTNLPDSDSPDRDKLFKIRPVVDALLEKCQQLEPEEYNSVDEQIIPTKYICQKSQTNGVIRSSQDVV